MKHIASTKVHHDPEIYNYFYEFFTYATRKISHRIPQSTSNRGFPKYIHANAMIFIVKQGVTKCMKCITQPLPSLPGCYAISTGKLPTSGRLLRPQFKRTHDKEDEGTTILRNTAIYKSTGRHIPKGLNFQERHCENLKSRHHSSFSLWRYSLTRA
jgi:hypothetical protein